MTRNPDNLTPSGLSVSKAHFSVQPTRVCETCLSSDQSTPTTTPCSTRRPPVSTHLCELVIWLRTMVSSSRASLGTVLDSLLVSALCSSAFSLINLVHLLQHTHIPHHNTSLLHNDGTQTSRTATTASVERCQSAAWTTNRSLLVASRVKAFPRRQTNFG